MEKSLFPCPICCKEFPEREIEAHASKCLFLTESARINNASNFLKRPRVDSQSKAKSPSVGKKSGKNKSNQNSGNLSQAFFAVSSPSSTSSASNPVEKSSSTSSNQISTDRNGTCDDVDLQVSKKGIKSNAPLAERMRPASIDDYVGQTHILGKESLLVQLLSKGEIPNVILWGPPGCGKTSLANVIAHICKADSSRKIRYVKLSAAIAGVADVKEAAKVAENELRFGRRTVIFMDEIHRFNKLQQDIFLPHVEAGTITLIGATTENPSFSLNSALLSRCRVIVLEKLTIQNVINILIRGVESLGGEIFQETFDTNKIPMPKFFIDQKTVEFLAETSDGDARIALGGLELSVQSMVSKDADDSSNSPGVITLNDIKDNLKKTHMLYDRTGDQHYDIISAFHKSVRASEENASLYWLARMIAGGEDPVYIARRMVRAASEDIGLEDPKALGIAVQTMQACKLIGMPDCDVLLAQCATYLARAPKSRLMEDSLRAAQRVVANHKGPQPSVPLHLRNAPTKLMKDLDYGKGYNMKHHNQSGLSYLPEGLEDVNFFVG